MLQIVELFYFSNYYHLNQIGAMVELGVSKYVFACI